MADDLRCPIANCDQVLADRHARVEHLLTQHDILILREGWIPDSSAAQGELDPYVEHLARLVHRAYLDTCERLGLPVKPENAVPYHELSEVSKELDRATARVVANRFMIGYRATSSYLRASLEQLATAAEMPLEIDGEPRRNFQLIDALKEFITLKVAWNETLAVEVAEAERGYDPPANFREITPQERDRLRRRTESPSSLDDVRRELEDAERFSDDADVQNMAGNALVLIGALAQHIRRLEDVCVRLGDKIRDPEPEKEQTDGG